MNKLGIVIKHTFIQNVKSPIFLLIILMPFIIGGFGTLMATLNSSEQATVAVVSPEQNIGQSFKKLDSDDIKYSSKYTNIDEAKKALIAGDIDGYLTVDFEKGKIQTALYNSTQSKNIDQSTLQSNVNQIGLGIKTAALNLKPATVRVIITPTTYKTHTSAVSNGKLTTQSSDLMNQKSTAVIVVSVIFFIMLILYSTTIASNVGREKGERVMEIILSSIDPVVKFLGEVLGTYLVMLFQIIVYIILGCIFKNIIMTSSTKDMLKNVHWEIFYSPEMIFALIFSLVGVFLYLVIAAMLGSIVSNVEQVNQAMLPLMIPAMFTYILIFTAASASSFVKIFAFVPLMSQTLMPFLLVLGKASWFEAIISLLIEIIFTVVMTYVSGKMYRSNVLVYSDKGFFAALRQSMALGKKAKI